MSYILDLIGSECLELSAFEFEKLLYLTLFMLYAIVCLCSALLCDLRVRMIALNYR